MKFRPSLFVLAVQLCIFVIICHVPCFAQERTMNSGAVGMLRSWPGSGDWQVGLVRATDNRLVCLAASGRNNPDSDTYIFGIERDSSSWHLFVIDKDSDALLGDYLTLLIDNTEIGSYKIDKRKDNFLRAPIPTSDQASLVRLLSVGGEIKFVTGQATYTSSLNGMSEALIYMNDCLVEAATLSNVNH